MLDQVTLARPLLQHVGHQLAGGVELVIAGKDEAAELLLVVALADEVTAEDLQPAVALPHFLPQVVGGEAEGVGCVAGPARITAVEGQEVRRRAGQARAHHHFGLADGEMHQRAAGEGQQRLDQPALGRRVAIEAILVNGITHALGEVRLQLGGGHRNAIDEQHQVERILGIVQ